MRCGWRSRRQPHRILHFHEKSVNGEARQSVNLHFGRKCKPQGPLKRPSLEGSAPWDGKTLQIEPSRTLPMILQHILPQVSRCGKNGKSLQWQCLYRVSQMGGRQREAPAPTHLPNTIAALALQRLSVFPATTFLGQDVL